MQENQLSSYSAVLGTVVSNIRKSQNIEQSVISESLGISQASYSRLESGKSVITVNQLFTIANKLGVKSSELIARTESAITSLEQGGFTIVSQSRGNSTTVKQSSDSKGDFIVGAALGALLIGLLTNKK